MSHNIGEKQNVTSIVQVKARGRPDPTQHSIRIGRRAGEYSHVPTLSGVGAVDDRLQWRVLAQEKPLAMGNLN